MLSRITFWLAAFVAVIYVGFGFLHPLLGDWNSSADRVLFAVVVGGGGLLIVAGLVLFNRSPWGSAALIAVGAVAGAVGLVWTLLMPLLAIALVVLSVWRAWTTRQLQPATT